MLGVVAAGWLSLHRDPALLSHDFGSDPGPALVPRLLLAALALGGGALALQGAWALAAGASRRGRAPAAGAGARAGRLGWPILFVVSLLAYQQALPLVGYRGATVAFCGAWMLVLTRRWEGRWRLRSVGLAVVAALAVTGAIYYVFKGLVRVPLP